MATRRDARKTAKTYGKGYKVKTAKNLSAEQRTRTVQYMAKTKKRTGEVKTVQGGTRVPYFAIVAPKKKKQKARSLY